LNYKSPCHQKNARPDRDLNVVIVDVLLGQVDQVLDEYGAGEVVTNEPAVVFQFVASLENLGSRE
jgi:hypothetical protein